ncbi:MAG TPA: zinc-binding dehydrogenase [Gaiellaceae bacterium]|jgi:NADPH:quinone reductase-like Zn-dependent oxidoreductase|nr:zinc-binding dehydrogenase [Gaiellaceae bacterium]
MRAATIQDGRIVVEERPDPVPGDGEILIRVRAAGINGADLGQRAGYYPPPPGVTDVPGLECAGETEDGERVMALLAGGGHAELAVVHHTHVMPVPDNVSWEQAGGFPEAFATAHDAIFTQAELHPGERLLVNGAAGGVGVAGVQLGVLAGAEVTANARHHHEELRALGASTDEDGEYDVILELVGGPNLSTNLEKIALKGRIAVIGVGAGRKAEIDFGLLMGKRGRIHASHLRARSREEKEDVIRRVEGFALRALARGELTVPVEETFPLERAQEAYDRFAAGGKFGKIVICP